ncbi:PAS domain S-box-containing protein/diguanylate cyclase (GGDEF)-like protein [Desulfobotulus alkaliphilus]|uniref:PAS domain S-box-containing protein/diguanylate cyclase (GGDEF)-like protein n=2 Tax=Desulfobotulus alkaliphilus TaxID=622671 RepID=A0A562RHN5_9BACT|nr:PAS domain S-box-containing protein/diguanylate cyclase (GGDEF)-like protein [Desulfobotulus alkaliphilus]
MSFCGKIKTFFMLMLLCSLPVLSHGQREPVRETLVVSLDHAWPPFSFLDDGGRPAGMLIELWQEITRIMGMDVRFFLTDWAESIEAVKDGRAHVHGGLVPSPERSEFMDFSAEIMGVHTYAFAASELIPLRLEIPDGAEVGVTLGSYEQEFMRLAYPDLTLRPFLNNQLMVQAALHGEVQLFVADYPTGMYLLDRYGEPGQFYAVTLLYTRYLAAGLPPGSRDLQDSIDVALSIFGDEELQRISQRWMRSERVEVLPGWLLPVLGAGLLFLVFAGGGAYLLALRVQRRRLLAELGAGTRALKESEARFRTLADHATAGIYVLQNRHFVLVNAAMGHILGYNEEELLAHEVSFFVHPDHREVAVQMTMERLEGKDVHSRYEMKILRKDGGVRWVELSLGTLLYRGMISSAGTVFDVTERKELEEKLRISEETFRAMVENANDIIFSMDMDGVLTYVSPNWTEILGHDVSHVRGQSFTAFMHPDDLAAGYAFLDLIYDTRKKQGGISYRVTHRDGGWRWHTSNASPFFDGEGHIAGIHGIARDITDIKYAAESRETALAMLNKVAANIPGAIYQFRIRPDGSYHFPYASERVQEIFGVHPEELMEDASPAFNAMHPDDLGSLMESILDSAANLSLWQNEFRVRRANGAYRWFSGQSVPELQDDGAILWHGYFADIQDWKDAEERITHMALHDPLTGLPNRTLFEDRVEQALIQGEREKDTFALLFIDLDRFKPVNDTLGHRVGDLLLQEAARRMEKLIRASDTAARIGGDEFVILLRKIASREDAARIGANICRELRRTFCIEGHELRISASIGIALYPEHGRDLITLCKRADRAMYHSKASGRDRASFFAQKF